MPARYQDIGSWFWTPVACQVRVWLLLLSLLCLLVPCTVLALNPINFTSALGGDPKVVCLHGNYAYVGAGQFFWVMDYSQPTSPQMISCTPTAAPITDVFVSGSNLFAAAGSSGLLVWDIQTPDHPLLLANLASIDQANGVFVKDQYAYVAAGSAGLKIIDISNPAAPVEFSQTLVCHGAQKVRVDGTLAYVADDSSSTQGLHIIDIADKLHPVQVGYYSAWATDVQVDHGRAFLQGAAFQILSVTNTAQPYVLGTDFVAPAMGNIALAGTLAIVTGHGYGNQGVAIYDVSNPAAPAKLSSYDTANGYFGLAVSAAQVLAAGSSAGLHRLDFSNASSPALVSKYEMFFSPSTLCLAGSWVYLLDAKQLWIVDATDSTAMKLKGHCPLAGELHGLTMSGSMAYVAAGSGGLRLVDVSHPEQPLEKSQAILPDSAQGVAVAGAYAYVAANAHGLQVVNVSDAANPLVAGSCALPGEALGVTLSGNLAAIADGSAGLRLVNVENPAQPREIGVGSITGSAAGVSWNQTNALVAAGSKYAQWLDLTQPELPKSVRTIYCYNCQAAKLAGTLAYLVPSLCELDIQDINQPDTGSGRAVYAFEANDYPHQVEVAGAKVYVANTALTLLDFNPVNQPPADTAHVDFRGKNAIAYPVPATTEVRFLVSRTTPADITIGLYNMAGEKVAFISRGWELTWPPQPLVWDCHGAAPGIYLAVVAVNGKVVQTLKVAVKR